MPKRSSVSVTRACRECQKRKGKCHGGNPCLYCVRAKRPCVYEDRPVRLPLTRKNIEMLERRCLKLETMFRQLHPDVDLTDVVNGHADHSLEADSDSHVDGMTVDSSIAAAAAATGMTFGSTTRATPDSISTTGFSSDSPNESPDYFEWYEDLTGKQEVTTLDGTVCFGNERKDCGYIGEAAGASVLQIIRKLLDIHRIPENKSNSDHRVEMAVYAERELSSGTMRLFLVDAYFRTFNSFYPVVHEPFFRRQYAQFEADNIPPQAHFHTLLRLIAAIGSLCSSTVVSTADYSFYLSARARLGPSMVESGTVEQLQILLLMANYLQKRDRPNTGYNLLGLAVRMAIGMGLHKEFAPTSFADARTAIGANVGGTTGASSRGVVRSETKRRLWWVLYLFDSGASITFGRPPVMADRIVDVNLPLNIDDRNLDLEDPVPSPVSGVTPYTAFVAFAKLSVISSRMFERFFFRYRHITNALEMTEHLRLIETFDSQLAQWRNELCPEFYSDDCPSWFRGPKAVARWREQNVRSLMYQGILESAIQGGLGGILPLDYLSRCLRTSLEAVNSVSLYIQNNPSERWWGVTWYATYYLFHADLLLILVMLISYRPEYNCDRAFSSKALSDCFEALDRSRRCFEILEISNTVASRCLKTIDQIVDIVKRTGQKTEVGDGNLTPPPEFDILVPELGNKLFSLADSRADEQPQFDDYWAGELFNKLSDDYFNLDQTVAQ